MTEEARPTQGDEQHNIGQVIEQRVERVLIDVAVHIRAKAEVVVRRWEPMIKHWRIVHVVFENSQPVILVFINLT